MTDRISKLIAGIEALQASLESLEQRVAALEYSARGMRPAPAERPAAIAQEASLAAVLHEAPPPGEVVHVGATPGALLSIIGRTLLILAGAFLLRALTDGGTLPQSVGVTLGLTYATVLIVFTDRAGWKQRKLSASFLGLAVVLTAYPLLWESTARLGLLSPGASGAVLVFVTALGLLTAWRRRLRFVAAAFTLAALLTILALYHATRAMELYAGLLLLLGAATIWLAYSRRWHVMRWLVALTADVVVLRLVLLVAHPEGPRPPYEFLSIPAVRWLAVGLVLLYLGSFSLRALSRRRGVTAFEILQSVLALLVGYGGAVRIAQAMGSGGPGLGWSALLAALVCYAVAFAFLRLRLGRGRNFFYYAWLAIIIVLLGSPLVASNSVLVLSWCAMAVAAALLGGRFDRVTLRLHSVVYLMAAAAQAGLLASVFNVFTGSAAAADRWPSGLGLGVLAMSVCCYAVLVATQRGRGVPTLRRIPRFVVALLSVLGAGALTVTTLVRSLGPDLGEGDPSHVAIIRTAVLAIAAAGLAAAGRIRHLAELAWLVYPLLVAGGLKLMLEDLRHGSSTALFLSFLCYGSALIVAPRLRRVKLPRSEPNPGSGEEKENR